MNQNPAQKKHDLEVSPRFIWLLLRALQTFFIGILGLVMLIPYLFALFVWGRPPIVPRFSQVKRYLQLTWKVQPPEPGLSVNGKIWLTMAIFRKWFMSPVVGGAWLLDEAIYGRKLARVNIVEPIFVISAGRSGSTQVTRYLEDAPRVTIPNLLQSMLPFLWLWRLARFTVGRFVSPEFLQEQIGALLPNELLERHEFHPLKGDTFDGALLASHLNHLASYLGPETAAQELHLGRFPEMDSAQLSGDFVRLVDRIGRKQLLFSAAEQSCRLLIKGHFLSAANALQEEYPDACFLTVVRDPIQRLRSAINYLRVNPYPAEMGPTPWNWLVAWLLETEVDYCQMEMDWYSQNDETRRCVVPFADFAGDLENTMKHVYGFCFGDSVLPPHVPCSHPPRERKNYSVNRSLQELGITKGKLEQDLSDYIAWIKQLSVSQ